LIQNAADIDRDRFQIKIPIMTPNVTKIKIKSFGLRGAMIDGAFVRKTTDGDCEVDMIEENGALFSKPILLVSDGDDDQKYNGEGTDDGKNDQTLMADFGSKIHISFPELGDAQVDFQAQKAVGKVILNIRYMSPAGDVPADRRDLIDRYIRKMREIYRQVGIKVGVANIAGEQIPQAWLDAQPAPINEPENLLGVSECANIRNQIRLRQVDAHHIRIGYVSIMLKPDIPPFPPPLGYTGLAGGFTQLRQDGIVISLLGNDGLRLCNTAHEVGHTLILDHPDPDPTHNKNHLMYNGENATWRNNIQDMKRFLENEFEEIRTNGTIDNFYEALE
jgi:hypothetical protein